MTIIEIVERRKELYQEVDGFFYWWPDGYHHGCFTAHQLRQLANELDKRNALLNQLIDHENKATRD